MSETVVAHRPASRQGSPVPRRQLGTLSVNQRSYSRVSSKGAFGDDSPLMSPLPYYPRHRSVTFAEERSGVREERPTYNATYSASAPVSPVRQRSPPPVSILKANSSFPDDGDSGAVPAAAVPAATVSASGGHHKDPLRSSPVPPPRGRSNSRQRLAARRREAQLHHSFYDDSFVEDFVLSAKTELEKEEAERRRVEEQLRAEQEKARRAERRVSEATEKITALQHAKEVLMAATVRRHASVTPSPARATADKSKRNSSLLRELEADPDPAVQEALQELSRQSLVKQQQQQHQQQQQRRRSMPIVSEDALVGTGAEGEEDGAEGGDNGEARKRARLEKIVSSVLSKKGKSKSKHSVVVIDWSDIDSNDDHDNEEEEEEREPVSRPVGNKRQRSHQTKSRSVAVAPDVTLVASTKASRKPSARRAASARERHPSTAPDLGDSLLFEEEAEEERPILLPRRQHHRPAPTRSISHIDAEAADDDDDVLDRASSVERMARRPPRATHAPPTRRRRGPAAIAATAAVRAPASRSRRVPAVEAEEAEAEEAFTPAPAPRPRRAAAPRADPNDPMAVFFEAAFPSPSKFDEMMMQAGGLPETRRGGGGGGRGQGRQPNLVLPSSIGRRR